MKKVVIIGPESTGKSTLAEQLARHYQTEWVPEYAREWLTAHGMNYSYDDLLLIARGQLSLEDEYAAMASAGNRQLLFIDTDMYVMKVWCEFVFGNCHKWILDRIVERSYDLYLLCMNDLPWVADHLREYPEEGPRKQLYLMYRDLLSNQQTPWIEIGGTNEERLETAVKAVDALADNSDYFRSR